MQNRHEQRLIYTLTSKDLQRIKNLLQSVEEAVVELVNYRCVRPIDPKTDLLAESVVYEQTGQIIEQYNRDGEILF